MSYLFTSLLEVSVGLKFNLFSDIWSIHHKQSLSGIDFLYKDGNFLVIPHLEMKQKMVRFSS